MVTMAQRRNHINVNLILSQHDSNLSREAEPHILVLHSHLVTRILRVDWRSQDTLLNSDYLWSLYKWSSKIDQDLCVQSILCDILLVSLFIMWAIKLQPRFYGPSHVCSSKVIRNVIDNRKSNWTSISQPLCHTAALWSGGGLFMTNLV